jgi:hypothetical protein
MSVYTKANMHFDTSKTKKWMTVFLIGLIILTVGIVILLINNKSLPGLESLPLSKEPQGTELSDVYCQRDQDCGFDYCHGCEVELNSSLSSEDKSCKINCPAFGEPKCVNNQCVLVEITNQN